MTPELDIALMGCAREQAVAVGPAKYTHEYSFNICLHED